MEGYLQRHKGKNLFSKRNEKKIYGIYIYKKYITTEEHIQMADAYAEARQQFSTDGLLPAKVALLEGRFGDANMILLKKING